MKPQSHEEHIRHTFDAFCKKVLRNEARDYLDEIARKRSREISLVYGLVVRLCRAVHVDRAFQKCAVVLAGEAPQFLYESGALFLRTAAEGLHRVYPQLQFRQLQSPGSDEVAILHISDADDIHAEIHEQLDIAVHVLPVGLDAMGSPKPKDVCYRYMVGFVCLLQEKLQQ